MKRFVYGWRGCSLKLAQNWPNLRPAAGRVDSTRVGTRSEPRVVNGDPLWRQEPDRGRGPEFLGSVKAGYLAASRIGSAGYGGHVKLRATSSESQVRCSMSSTRKHYPSISFQHYLPVASDEARTYSNGPRGSGLTIGRLVWRDRPAIDRSRWVVSPRSNRRRLTHFLAGPSGLAEEFRRFGESSVEAPCGASTWESSPCSRGSSSVHSKSLRELGPVAVLKPRQLRSLPEGLATRKFDNANAKTFSRRRKRA